MTRRTSPEPKTPEQLQACSAALGKLLASQLNRDWDLLERPAIVAGLFACHPDEAMSITSHDFASTLDAFIGMRAARMIAPYLKLHTDLTDQGYTSADNRLEFGTDAYAWAADSRSAPAKDLGIDWAAVFKLPDSVKAFERAPDPCARQARAIVLQTQSSSFLVVLNYEYGRWQGLHVREFWPDLGPAMAADGYLLNLGALRERRDLTVQDVVAWSTRACVYSDVLPGVDYPERPNLASLLDGSLFAGEEEAGIGLRYGDFRDKGHVLSMRVDSSGKAEAPKMVHTRMGSIAYVANNMAHAIGVLAYEMQHGKD